MKCILRKYDPEDAKTICRWLTSETGVFEWSADRIGRFPPGADDINAHHEHTMRTERFMPYSYVKEDGSLAGHIAIRFPDENDLTSARLGFVIIDPALRGCGIGRRMVEDAAEHAASELGAKKVDLSVYTRNIRAVRCYEAAGFRQAGEPGIHALPPGDWEYIIMEKFF